MDPSSEPPEARANRAARSAPTAEFRIRGRIWLYPGKGGWHFVTLPRKPAAEIKSLLGHNRGWGAVPVHVRIGRTEWATSIFPDRKSGSYLLAIKAEVRRSEDIAEGDTISAIVSVALPEW